MLLDLQGTTLAELPMKTAGDELYRSSTGRYYVAVDELVYPVTCNDNSLALDSLSYDKSFLSRLRNCLLTTNSRYFYRFIDEENLYASFELRQPDMDSSRVVLELYDAQSMVESQTDLAKANRYLSEYIYMTSSAASNRPSLQFGHSAPTEDKRLLNDIYALGTPRTGIAVAGSARYLLQKAQQQTASRYLFDKNVLKKLVSPAFTCDTGVVIFDLLNEKIRFFDTAGEALYMLPLLPEIKRKTEAEILKDDITGQFYVHQVSFLEPHTVQKIDMATGSVTGPVIKLEKPLAEKVRVRDGQIYYLWQETRETRQLFRQKGF